jgi:hypothetical protein
VADAFRLQVSFRFRWIHVRHGRQHSSFPLLHSGFT